MGPPHIYSRPMPGGAAASYGRGGPLPYGGPQAPPMDAGARGGSGMGGSGPVAGGSNGYPPFEGGFSRGSGMGRDSGFGGDRVTNGGMGDRPGRFGAGSNNTGSRSGGRGGRDFDGGYSGGRGGGRFSSDGGRGSSGGRGGGRHGSSRDDLDNLTLPKVDFGNLVPFEKNFYVEHHSVRAMTEEDVALYRARREITVEGHDVPRPIQMFHEANFPGITSGDLNVFMILAKSFEICLIELVY